MPTWEETRGLKKEGIMYKSSDNREMKYHHCGLNAAASHDRKTRNYLGMVGAVSALAGCGDGDLVPPSEQRCSTTNDVPRCFTIGAPIASFNAGAAFANAGFRAAPIYTAQLTDGRSLSDIGLSISDEGMISGTFSGATDVRIIVTASDGIVEDAHTFSFEANEKPVVDQTRLPDNNVLTPNTSITPISVHNAFEDPDDDLLTYSAVIDGSAEHFARTGLKIGEHSGVISGTFGGTSDLVITVTASDGAAGGEATASLFIDINEAPTASRNISDRILRVGETLNLSIPNNAFEDSNSDALTYSAVLVNGTDTTTPVGRDPSENVPFAFNDGVLSSAVDASHAGQIWTLRIVASDGSLTAATEFNVNIPAPTGARTVLPFWLSGADEYGIGYDSGNINNPINGVHSLTDSDDDSDRGTNGENHWNGHGRYSEPVTLTWSFADAGAAVNVPPTSGSLYRAVRSFRTTEEFSPSQKASIRDIFDHIQGITDITFTEVNDRGLAGSGDIRIVLGSQSQFGSRDSVPGFGSRPVGHSPKGTTFTARNSHVGDIYIVKDYLPDDAYETPYGSENHTIAHELMHALGLDHPFNDNAGAQAGRWGYHEIGGAGPLPNSHGAETGGAHQTPLTDTFMETLMTYHNPYAGLALRIGSDFDPEYSVVPDNNVPWQPGVYDIAALQHLYGANIDYRSDNTIYNYDSDTLVFETIWDGGGTDTISHSGNRNSVIDLNPGGLSTVGFFGGPTYSFSAPEISGVFDATWAGFHLGGDSDDGVVSISGDGRTATFIPDLAGGGIDGDLTLNYTVSGRPDMVARFQPPNGFYDDEYATHNVTIAHGVVIENAVGGDGNDRIIGNSANNVMTGGGGADTFVIARNPVSGTDRITDFTVGLDMIEFSGITSNDINSTTTFDGNYVFTGFGMQLTLEGVTTELWEGAHYMFS